MKNYICFFYFIGIASFSFGQTYRFVNNNGNTAPEHFTSLQTAINAASDNDILILSPSLNNYGNVTLNKKLHIIGAGFYISQNPTLNISSINMETNCGTITVSNSGSGSRLEGFSIHRIDASTKIHIEKCNIGTKIILNNADSSKIIGCYFSNPLIGESGTNNDYNLSVFGSSLGVNVLNNIFDCESVSGSSPGSSTSDSDNVLVDNSSSAIIENNIFRDRVDADNCMIVNNIFLKSTDGFFSPNNSSGVSNNIFAGSEPIYAQSNVTNFGQNNIFVGFPTQGSFSFDSRFALLTNSPGLGYGINGEDCGVFDGTNNYKLSGIPKRPLIYEFNIPDSSPANNNINLILKVRKE